MILSRRMPIVRRMRVPPGLSPFARTTVLPSFKEELFFYDAGANGAPGMLLLHGLGDEADTWRHIIPTLSEQYRVIAPDLPGFGRSAFPSRRRLTFRYVSTVLSALLEHLGIRTVILVGHSLGAAIGQVTALAYPDKFLRLVLADGGLLEGVRFEARFLLGLLPGLGESRQRKLSQNLDAAYASLKPYYADLDAFPREEREFLRERVGERVSSARQIRAYFSIFRNFAALLVFKGAFISSRARQLPIPTLYIWGEQDRIVPVKLAQATCRKHPGAKLVVIPGAGHAPHQEAPREFLRAIDQLR